MLIIATIGAYRSLGQKELTIRWSTESELDMIGFNLYRAESADGEYVKINQELIPSAADPFLGGEHSFTDPCEKPGLTYHYQLETIDRNGRATRSDPIAIPCE